MPIEKDYKPKPSYGGDGKDFDPLPVSTYQVQILDVGVSKDQVKFKKNSADPDVKEDLYKFTFVIVEEGEYLRRRLWKECRQIMNPAFDGGSASALYEIFSSAKKVMLSKEEAISANNPEDINSLIGLQLQLLVKQKLRKDGSVKNVIEAYLPAKANIPFDPTKKFEKKKLPNPNEGEVGFEEQLAQETKALNDAQDNIEEETVDVDEIPF